jgi:hypothetical protein
MRWTRQRYATSPSSFSLPHPQSLPARPSLSMSLPTLPPPALSTAMEVGTAKVVYVGGCGWASKDVLPWPVQLCSVP